LQLQVLPKLQKVVPKERSVSLPKLQKVVPKEHSVSLPKLQKVVPKERSVSFLLKSRSKGNAEPNTAEI
jgi:hypothetical protein